MADTLAITAFLKEFPRRDWTCRDVTDIGENPVDRYECEICGTRIRFVHHMTHHTDPRELSIGCICAGLISNDIEGAKAREQGVRNKAAQRNRWLSRRWKQSLKGNEYLRLDGSFLVVFPSKFNRGWCYGINGNFSFQTYETAREAKLALFDAWVT